MYFKIISPFFIFNVLLIITFSISVNSFNEINIINTLSYILFHLTFIYFLFYHYHYSHFFLVLIYGVLFDIFLLNTIGGHLICLILLILIYLSFKKYLFLLSPNQLSIIIFITLIFTVYIEILLAFLLNNIYFSVTSLFSYFVISSIIYIPAIYILNKIDR